MKALRNAGSAKAARRESPDGPSTDDHSTDDHSTDGPGAGQFSATRSRIAAPAPPAPPQPYSFPVMATVAPVVVSLAIWFVTRSPFALVFAALGPAVALASLADARIQSRRRRTRETTRFRTELAATKSDIVAAHRHERAELVETLPSIIRLIAGRWTAAERWSRGDDEPIVVGVGSGTLRSSLALDGVSVSPRSRDPAHAQLAALVDEAARLGSAPVVVDAALGIGLLGPRLLTAAVARGVLLQVLASLSPADHAVVVETDDPSGWAWLAGLPHPVRVVPGPPAVTTVRVTSAASPRAIVVALAESPRALPSGTRVVLSVRGIRSLIEQHPDRGRLGPIAPHPVSVEQAIAVARDLAAQAHSGGAVDAAVPQSVAFAELGDGTAVADPRPGSLATVVAATAGEPLVLDLVRHGPHAIVGGTTGSGKSELLTAWILAITRDHPPGAASVLLVDFKGGSAFTALTALPHCAGMITDLDEAGAQRALQSLAAEIRRREKHLARAGAKSIDALTSAERLPRLVIVVDEFAAMVSGFPDLHALFADIAARGRSLGVHLILCTQRPAGVIRDAVLANSALRLSLRVNNRADSRAVVGSDDAAELPVEPRGRALASTDGGEPVLAQFPLVTQGDIDQVVARWSGDPARPHRPWLDPLPTLIPLDLVRAAAHDGIPFGLLDDPDNQAQPVACYRPGEHGNVLIVGASGSGKSTALAVLAASAAAFAAPGDIEGAWDALVSLADDAPDGGHEPRGGDRLVLLDDLDALLARFPEDYEGAVLELLGRCLREGPPRGIHWAITAQRITPALHSVASLCGSRLLLRLPNRQEHVLAGGDGSDFVERLPPGAGRWQGHHVQVALPPAVDSPAPPAPRSIELRSDLPLAVVSSRPADFVTRLRHAMPEFARPGAVVAAGGTIHDPRAADVSVSAGSDPRAIVGDVDAWQAQWGALAALRSSHSVVVDGCTANEFRSVTRVRALPPVLDPRGSAFWLLAPDGSVARARLPHQ